MKSRSCDVMSERARPRLQERLEPDDRLDVEVVGRLVHQQDVGLAEQHARHRHAHLPAARQRAHVAVDPLVVEAEAVEDLARAALERVAAEVLVLLLHLAEAREDAVHVVGPVRVGHRLLQILELVVQVAEPAAAGDRLVEHRPAGHLLDVLAEVADRQSCAAPTRRPRRAAPRPTIMRKSVVLPEPFGPTSPTFSPGLSWNDASTNRTWRPYCLLMPENAIMAWVRQDRPCSSAPKSIVRSLSRGGPLEERADAGRHPPVEHRAAVGDHRDGLREVEHVGREQQRERRHALRRRADRVAVADEIDAAAGPPARGKERDDARLLAVVEREVVDVGQVLSRLRLAELVDDQPVRPVVRLRVVGAPGQARRDAARAGGPARTPRRRP